MIGLAGIAILCLSTVFIQSTRGDYLGCYDDAKDNPAFTVAGETTGEQDSLVANCIESCSPTFKYAGIQDSNACFCSSTLPESQPVNESSCDLHCSDMESDSCGGSHGQTSVYEVLVAEPPQGLTLAFQPEIPSTNDIINFQIALDRGEDIVFQFCYGDGSPKTEVNVTNMEVHRYLVPGTYDVSLTARQEQGDKMDSASSSLVIEQSVNSEVQLDCPELRQMGEVANCSVKIISGTSLEVIVDFGDSDSETHQWPDIPAMAIGAGVPQTQVQVNKTSDQSSYTAMPHSVIMEEGYITAFQLYGETEGIIELQVLYPNCGENWMFCSERQYCRTNCSSWCSDGKAFQPSTGSCQGDSTGDSSQSSQIKTYKVRHAITFTVQNGFNIFNLTKEEYIDVFPGDVLGYKSEEGVIASRNLLDEEISDQQSSSLDHAFEDTGTRAFLQAVVTFPVTMQLNHTYTIPGRFQVTIEARNAILKEQFSTKTQEIIIMTPIISTNLSISSETFIQASQTMFAVAAVTGGSNVTLTWNFGDGRQEQVEFKDIINDTEQFSQNVSYSSEGLFLIAVNASNEIGWKSDEKNITVEWPVTDQWTLTTNSPQLNPPGTINITLQFFGDNFPTSPTLDIQWGDGQNESNPLSNQSEWHFSHMFNDEQLYNTEIFISNHVSNHSETAKVKVINKIQNIHIDGFYNNSEDSTLRKGSGDKGYLFPPNSQLIFRITPEKGIALSYTMEYINGTYLTHVNNSNEIILDCFVKSGNYSVVIFGSNEIENRSESVEVNIIVSDVVTDLGVSDVTEDRTVGNPRQLNVTFKAPDIPLCIQIDYGDGSQFQSYGDSSVCETYFSKSNYFGNLMKPLIANHSYSEEKEYIVQLSACTTSCINATGAVFISFLPCFSSPFVWIVENSTDQENINPYSTFKRSKEIRISSRASVQCFELVESKRWWKIWKLNSEDKRISEEISVTRLTSSYKSMLTLPPLFLEYGVYKIQCFQNFTIQTKKKLVNDGRSTLSQSSKEEESKKYFHSNVTTYIKVTESELIPRIVGSDVHKITRKYGDIISLNAQFSTDPDDPQNRNFSVEWFCHQVAPQKEQLTGNWTNFSKDNIIDYPIQRSDSNSGNGGCFGSGPGFINLSNAFWELDSSLFYQNEATYEITGVIKKDDRKASAFLQIEVVGVDALNITINCATDTLCRRSLRGLALVPGSRIALLSQCEQKCPTESTIQWRVYEIDNEQNQLEILDFAKGIDDDVFILYEKFFNEYQDKEVFVIEVQVKSKDPSSSGSASIFFQRNRSPEEGSCTLSSTSSDNVALITDFQIVCNGWKDPEELGIDSYRYFAVRDFSNGPEWSWRLKLGVSSRGSADVILLCGNQTIQVEIEDATGMVTVVNVTYIEVKPLAKNQMKEFLSTNVVNDLENSGDQERMSQMFAAIATMSQCWQQNDVYPISEEDELEISNQITDYLFILQNVNFNNLDDAIQVSSSVSLMLDNGEFVDNRGRELASRLLEKLNIALVPLNNSNPQIMTEVTRNVLQIMAAITVVIILLILMSFLQNIDRLMVSSPRSVNHRSNQTKGNTRIVKERKALSSDFENINDIFYDTDIGYDENFQLPSYDDMKLNGIISDQKTKSPGQVDRMDQLIRTLSSKIFHTMVKNDDAINITTPIITATFSKITKNRSAELYKLNDSSFTLPSFCSMNPSQSNCTNDDVLSLLGIEWPGTKYCYGRNLNFVDGTFKTVEIQILDSEGDEGLMLSNLSTPIDIHIPHSGEKALNLSGEINEEVPEMKWYESMGYHRIEIERPGTSISVQLMKYNSNASYQIYVRHLKKPTLDKYDFRIPWNSTEGSEQILIKSSRIENKIGFFYIGVKLHSDDFVKGNVSSPADDYSLFIYTSGCYYFDLRDKSWQDYGCQVEGANLLWTVCSCNHLTSFSSGLFVKPNTIDFTYVFAHANFNDNLTIYCTIFVTIIVFLLLFLWSRRKDNQDKEKIGAAPLPDNSSQHKYLYELLVFTGDARDAVTDSVVNFILSGDNDETQIRVFGDEKRKIFRTDGVDAFVMSVPRPLGQLLFLRIWHDNSGKGRFASWYLRFVAVRDVQTGEKFQFICNRWLALEKDDGQIDRTISVASKDELVDFSHLFKTVSHKNLHDDHLWFSIFLRPPRSRFSRCQRLACCMALLYLSMLVNAMWYGRTADKPTTGLKMGPLVLSPEQIGVGIFSNLIIFPPSFIIVFLFRKSRPRRQPPSHINEAITQLKEGMTDNTKQQSEENEKTETRKEVKYKRKKSFTLPWWCCIIAWILCVLCIAASVFFLWAYGIQFGNDKTKKWVTSLIVAFFASVLITQPLKIFLMALLFSSICKKVNTDDDDIDDDEKDPQLQWDEEWMHDTNNLTIPRKIAYKPVDNSAFNEAREKRNLEVKMWQILREVFFYILFLTVLSALAYGTHDPNAYLMHLGLKTNFYSAGGQTSFANIKDFDDFWNWANSTLLTALRSQKHYNEEPPFGAKGFLYDEVNRLMGHAIIRQIRMRKGACIPPPFLKNFTCVGSKTTIEDEDKKDYGLNWNESALNDPRNYYPEFRYTSSEELNGVYIIGNRDVYSGGGYVIHLQGDAISLKKKFTLLKDNEWLDKYSRAIFTEFAVYNAQVNLFGTVILQAEFIAGGGILADYSINAFRLLPYEGGFSLFIIFCQVLFLLYFLYYVFCILRGLCSGFRQFFLNGWNWLLILTVAVSIASIVIFILRTLATQEALKKFNTTKGNVYVNIQRAQYLSDAYGYMLSLLITFTTLKFIKLLRFNKRLSSLTATLTRCTKDLAGYGLVFFILLLSFANLFFLTLSSLLPEHATYIQNFETMLNIMIGKFKFSAYLNTSHAFGPIMFFSFMFIMNIIMINLLITIIIQSFEAVKQDFSKSNYDFHIFAYVHYRLRSFLGLRNSRQKWIQDKPIDTLQQPNNPAQQFPQKVDSLLNYINSIYFDGKMDEYKIDGNKTNKRKKPNFCAPGWDSEQHRVYSSN